MREFDDMLNKGLAEVSTVDRQALALTCLIPLAQYRDRCYRFFLAMAGAEYRKPRWYWQDYAKANP